MADHTIIGRVTRCSTRGFVGAIRLPEPDLPTFGSLCQAEAQQGRSQVVGLIYDISIQDDEFARQLVTAEGVTPEQLADSQANRQVPVEFSALAVGYANAGQFHYGLPPQPPLTLAPIHTLSDEEALAFSASLDFLPLLLSATEVPVDDLLVAALRRASALRPRSQRAGYLLQAGRVCARLLGRDLTRLETVLNGLAVTA